MAGDSETRRPARLRRPWVASVLAGIVAATYWVLWAPTFLGAANTPSLGAARIVTPDDTSDPLSGSLLSSGGSSTAFSLGLPHGAACPGDSATGNYRVQSFMVRAGTDPVALQFGSNGPLPATVGTKFMQPLFDATSTASYANAMTAKAEVRDGAGWILSVPAFKFLVFSPGDIPPGAYRVGLACTLGPPSTTQVKSIWDTQLVIEADPSDPVGIKWTAMSTTPASGPDGTETAVKGLPPDNAKATTTPTSAVQLDSPGRSPASVSSAGSGSTGVESAPKVSASSTSLAEESVAKREAEEVATRGGDPTFTPLVEILTEVSSTKSTIWSLLGWVSVLVVVLRMAVLLRRSSAVPKSAHP